jgi:hypothetical protein
VLAEKIEIPIGEAGQILIYYPRWIENPEIWWDELRADPGYCGTGGLDGEIVQVAMMPLCPSGMIGPGSKAWFRAVELSTVLE